MESWNITYGLIFANDLTKPEKALELSRLVAPYVDGIKIGIVTILDTGVSMIKKTRELTSKMIIADFKVADIGFWNKEKRSWEGTNAKIVEKAIEAGADYVICHSIVGVSSIQESIEVAHSKGGKVLTLPYMTHKGAELFFGHPIDINHITETLEKVAIKLPEEKLERCKTMSDVIIVLGDHLGVDGFIGPANNPEVIKRYREFTDKEIFGPGIGRQAIGNLTPKDQMKIFYNICRSRSAVIIGSAIYASSNPAEVAKEFSILRDQIVNEIGK
jgi:orotidine-5'-phosphate decarboxylase